MKKKHLKVIFYLGGDKMKASTRVRVLHYLAYLRKEKVYYLLVYPRNKKENKFLKTVRDLFEIFKARRFDVVYIQKRKFPKKQLSFLKKINQNIIYDFDDALFALPKNCRKNQSGFRKYLENFINSIKEAKMVVVSNSFLEKYAKKYNSSVCQIPSVILTREYLPKNYQKSDQIILGYTCNTENLIYLKMIYQALFKICQKFQNVYLKITSSKPIDLPGVRTIFEKFTIENHVKTLQSFDIGLMPYPNEDWFKGKAGFKGLECMGVGVPVVASPVGMIPEIIEDSKNGFLARTNREWFEKLSVLISDEKLRKKMGEEARQKVIEKYSIEVWQKKLIEIFYQMLKS